MMGDPETPLDVLLDSSGDEAVLLVLWGPLVSLEQLVQILSAGSALSLLHHGQNVQGHSVLHLVLVDDDHQGVGQDQARPHLEVTWVNLVWCS